MTDTSLMVLLIFGGKQEVSVPPETDAILSRHLPPHLQIIHCDIRHPSDFLVRSEHLNNGRLGGGLEQGKQSEKICNFSAECKNRYLKAVLQLISFQVSFATIYEAQGASRSPRFAVGGRISRTLTVGLLPHSRTGLLLTVLGWMDENSSSKRSASSFLFQPPGKRVNPPSGSVPGQGWQAVQSGVEQHTTGLVQQEQKQEQQEHHQPVDVQDLTLAGQSGPNSPNPGASWTSDSSCSGCGATNHRSAYTSHPIRQHASGWVLLLTNQQTSSWTATQVLFPD